MEMPPTQLAVGTEVRFSSEWLLKLSEAEARQFSGRQGRISGYRLQTGSWTPYPIVDFEKAGRRKAVRIFEVPWYQLELVITDDTTLGPGAHAKSSGEIIPQ